MSLPISEIGEDIVDQWSSSFRTRMCVQLIVLIGIEKLQTQMQPGISCNGVKHEQKFPSHEKVFPPSYEPLHWTNGSQLEFVVDWDQRVCHVSIDGRRHEAVFRDLPAVIYPAVSNCGAPGTYLISF